MIKINQEILVWARETAGLTLQEAAKKLNIADTHISTGEDSLANYEKTGEISRSLLVKMSKVYHRPLLTFYLSSPPRKGDRGQDFRTLPNNYSNTENVFLDVLIRNIIARQNILHSIIQDDEEFIPLDFIGSCKMSDGIASVLSSIQNELRISQIDFYSQSSPENAFALLRKSAEAKGIFVLLIGDLGSYRTSIEPEIFRGFSIADKIAPFVVINDRDNHSAWSFTLLHELTHLWLGQTGVSNSNATMVIEQFCNDVAGEFLLPGDQLRLLTVSDDTSFEDALMEISKFADERNLSCSMIAYKLYRFGKINKQKWEKLNTEFYNLWRSNQVKHHEAVKSEHGPNYYIVKKHRVGKALIQLVDRMMVNGSISTTKAGEVLGVKAKNVGHLLELEHIG